ncbi:MAG: EF-hand domain-containing protein [Planctomycetes bacterium]|nr:EF-hand domain-containing protein [Planctomycetota bacterium]
MYRFLVVAACVVVCLPLPASAQPAQSDAVDLAFLAEGRPYLLRIQVKVEGKSVASIRNDYLKKWFDHFDRNGDGKLDAKEIEHAPTGPAMLQFMRPDSFFGKPPGKQVMRLADFVKDASAGVGFADFVRYYDKQGVAALQVSSDPAGAYYQEVDDALFKLLDRNGDGKISKQELDDAFDVLMKLDTNDDEYVSAQEIVPGISIPFGPGAPMKPGAAPPARTNTAFYTITGDADAGLATALLARYDADKNGKLSRAESGLPKDVFDLLDADKNGDLDAAELAHWHRRPADFNGTVHLDKSSRVELAPDKLLVKAITQVDGNPVISLASARVQILGENAVRTVVPGRANQFVSAFRQADTKKRGYLELKDVQMDRQLQFLAQVFPIVDRDGDGKITEKELQAFADLQAGGADGFASLSIAESGRNLFKLLDANGDGRLSPRELKNAWTRLSHLDANKDGSIDRSELVRQFQLTVRHGPTKGFDLRKPGMDTASPRSVVSPKTPLWFRKMDRNGDGDVSPREFLGTREEFNRIDTDGDGLISPAEAEQYDRKIRTEK